MIRIAICDDDLNFLNDFERMITSSFADAGQQIKTFTFSNGKTLIEKIEKEKQIFDLIFLDVDMPVINGFQTAYRLRQLNNSFILIFTTMMENDVREGYKYNAHRYIFKNNLRTEIPEAVSSILTKLKVQSSDCEPVTFKYRIAGVFETVEIKKNDIICFRLDKSRRVILQTTYSEYELLKKPLSEYQSQMQNDAFYIHIRYYLVNFNHVADIDSEYFIMDEGSRIPLGLTKETRTIAKQKYMNFLEGRL